MSHPISPVWNHALHTANWAHALHVHTAPARLRRAAAAQAPDSWQGAGYRGAAQASSLMQSPLAWVAGGAVLGAAAAGYAIGPFGAAIAAHPAARLTFGDGVARGTHDRPASAWEKLQTSGLLGLPERFCLHAARTATAAAMPGCRPALLGIAVGLRALVQLPRALVGLASVAAAVGGAALGVLAHALARAFAAIRRFPSQVANIVAQLKAQYAYWESMLTTGATVLDGIHRIHMRAAGAWQRIAKPAATWGTWALRPPEILSPSQSLTPSEDTAADSVVVGRKPQGAQIAWLVSSGATACLQGVVSGAEALSHGAEIAGRVMMRIRDAMAYVAQAAAQAQRTQQLARTYAQLSEVAGRLPAWPSGLRLPAV